MPTPPRHALVFLNTVGRDGAASGPKPRGAARPLTFATLLTLLAAGDGAACRQATGLDDFELACAPGETDCPVPGALEDCAERRDTNGDGRAPPECSGQVAWLRTTPANAALFCPDRLFGGVDIAPVRRLVAVQSFGSWTGTAGSLRGTQAGCITGCATEARAFDGEGEQIVFNPPLPCDDDSGALHALARGQTHAYAGAAYQEPTRSVVVSVHRLSDATAASRWEWAPPEDILSFALAADTSAIAAIGLPSRVLFAEPDDSFPRARFRVLPAARVPSIALAAFGGTRTLLLAGQTTSPATDPGPCGLGATSPTAFVITAPLSADASTDPATPTPLTCDSFPLKLDIGLDTASPSMRVVAGKGSRACWAYVGNNDAGAQRRLRTGCFRLDDTPFDWQEEALLGDTDPGEVDIALDPFGHLLLTTTVRRATPLPLWDGEDVPIAGAGARNILVLKLHRDTGSVLWAHMLTASDGNARNPRITVDDDASAHLGVVTDGQPLRGNGLATQDSVPGQAVHFLGLLP